MRSGGGCEQINNIRVRDKLGRMSPRMSRIAGIIVEGECEVKMHGGRTVNLEPLKPMVENFIETDSLQMENAKGFEILQWMKTMGLVNSSTVGSEMKKYMDKQQSGRGITRTDQEILSSHGE